MKRSLLTLLIAGICFSVQAQPDLRIYGSLRQVMHESDTAEKVRLNLLGPLFDQYGLGVAAGLDGEIIILNGETYVTGVWNGSLVTDKSTDVGAALLVMSPVHSWDTLAIDVSIDNIGDLDKYLKEEVFKDNPFPFLIISDQAVVRWHVVKRPKTTEAMKNHKTLGLNGKFDGECLILGFFSTSHEGVFTHMGASTHNHFQSADKLYAGHVDDLVLNKGDLLLIPKGLRK